MTNNNVLVNGTPAINYTPGSVSGYNAAPSSTITLTLPSLAGVNNWLVSCTSANEDAIFDGRFTAVQNSMHQSGPLGPITFAMPAMVTDGYFGASFQFTSTINNDVSSQLTFGVFILNIDGSALFFGGETSERSFSTGNAQQLNQIIKTQVTLAAGGFIAGGDLTGNQFDQTVVGIQDVPVSATPPTDGYALIYHTSGAEWSPSPIPPQFNAAGDLSGNTSSQTVVGIQGHPVSSSAPSNHQLLIYNGTNYAPGGITDSNIGIASVTVGKLIPGTSGQVLLSTGASQPSWTSVSGDESISNTGAVTVTGLQNNAVDSISPQDGYVLTWKASDSKWTPEAITSGSITLGGDVTGPVNSNAVSKIQGTAVSSTAPVGPSVLQYNGTNYAPVGAPISTIWGKNATTTPFLSCVDDAPAVQAWLVANAATGGTLNVINPVFLTPIDFTVVNGLAAAGGGASTKLALGGMVRIASNKAEFDLANAITIDGSYGGVQVNNGGFNASADVYVYNSAGSYQTNEPHSKTTDGYVDGPFMYYEMYAGNVTFPPGLEGQKIQTSSITDPHWDGYWTCVNIRQGGNAPHVASNHNYVGMIFLGNSPNNQPIAWNTLGANAPINNGPQDIAWSCDGYNGNSGQAYTDCVGGKPCLRVKNVSLNQGSGSFSNTWKHWLLLSNCNNTTLNTTALRLLGAESNSVCYVNATVFYGLTGPGGGGKTTGLTLPDDGYGGTFGSPTIHTYEMVPVFRMAGIGNNVTNLSLHFTPGPCVVMDGFAGFPGNLNIGNVNTSTQIGAIPFIVDSVFEWAIRDCNAVYCGNSNTIGPNLSMLMTCNNTPYQQYCGIGLIENIVTYNGALMFQNAAPTALPLGGITINNMIMELVGNSTVPIATVIFDNGFSAYSNLKFNDFYPADANTNYFFDTIYPASPNNVADLFINNNFDSTFIGPNMLQGQPDLVMLGGYNPPPIANNDRPLTPELSMILGGVADLALIGNSDFSPVMTLPYQIPIPNLKTVAAWNALPGGGLTFSLTPGPDLSNTAIRMHAAAGINGVVAVNYALPNPPAVGDVVMTFMRFQINSTTLQISRSNTSTPFVFFTNTSIRLNNDAGSQNGFLTTDKTANFRGGQWSDCAVMATITTANGSSSNIQLGFNATGGHADYSVDPESLVILYIPATAGLSTAEITRLYRKLRRGVTSATVGDVAIPSRNGLSFGNVARIGNDGYVTSDTSPHTILSYTVPTSGGFNISGNWSAIVPGHAADGYFSSGQFAVGGYNHSGTITSNLQTIGSLYNCGVGGAAASTPITITTGTNVININVNSEYNLTTDWQLSILQTNTV